jgi:FkbM family methyltransferase
VIKPAGRFAALAFRFSWSIRTDRWVSFGGVTIKYIDKIRDDGITAILARRYGWYRARLMVNNDLVGRLVELAGNRIRIEGLKFSTDCPAIETAHKSTLFFGLHEIEERTLLRRCLPVDFPVVELGGGLGVVSCLANRKLASPARHVVVEAMPSVAALLQRNRDLNHCQFRVVNAALAYGSPTVNLGVNRSFVGSRIDGNFDATVHVPSITLGGIVDEAGFDRFALICDIEGAEAELTSHESKLIADRVVFALMEIHPGVLGEDGANRVVERFTRAGFRLADRMGFNWAFAKH